MFGSSCSLDRKLLELSKVSESGFFHPSLKPPQCGILSAQAVATVGFPHSSAPLVLRVAWLVDGNHTRVLSLQNPAREESNSWGSVPQPCPKACSSFFLFFFNFFFLIFTFLKYHRVL